MIPFRQVVIWGNKLDSGDTFSFIHYGLNRVSRFMGFKTLWLNASDNLPQIDLSRTLFLTEGGAKKLPIRKDCWYVVFNYDRLINDIDDAFAEGRAIAYQHWNGRGSECYLAMEKVGEMAYLDGTKLLHLPWATDRIPPEIAAIRDRLSAPTVRRCAFVGSMNWSGPPFDMDKQWGPFISACERGGVPFVCGRNRRYQCQTSNYAGRKMLFNYPEEAVTYVCRSLLAPSIQGHWQCEVGHLGDRIFKNLSYGKLGITNNLHIEALLGEHCVFCENTEKLFGMAMDAVQSRPPARVMAAMRLVAEKHTYVNRINAMLKALEVVAK